MCDCSVLSSSSQLLLIALSCALVSVLCRRFVECTFSDVFCLIYGCIYVTQTCHAASVNEAVPLLSGFRQRMTIEESMRPGH